MSSESPLPSYLTPQDLSVLLEKTEGLSQSELALSRSLLKSGLPPLVRPVHISLAFGISNRLLMNIAHNTHKFYRVFSIPKRNGTWREIQAPRVILKVLQRWILTEILTKIRVHPAAHGFIRRRSIVTNARKHVKAKYILNVDIEEFFPSIGYAEALWTFHSMGFPGPVCRTLALLCTRNGVLPQGAPTSPALSNLVFHPVDKRLSSLAEENRVTYTRYADDLTFSSQEKIRKGFVRKVEKVVRQGGFNLNERKVRVFGPGQRKAVTGMVVDKRPQPNQESRRKLRAIFHQASRNPGAYVNRLDELNGLLGFVNSYNKSKGREYQGIVVAVRKVR